MVMMINILKEENFKSKSKLNGLSLSFVCLFWVFSSNQEKKIHFITKGCKFLPTVDRHSRSSSSEGSLSMPHLPWHGTFVYNGHPWGPLSGTHTCCRAFGSGAVTTWFYDFTRSVATGIPATYDRGKRSNRLRSHGGGYHCQIVCYL